MVPVDKGIGGHKRVVRSGTHDDLTIISVGTLVPYRTRLTITSYNKCREFCVTPYGFSISGLNWNFRLYCVEQVPPGFPIL